MQDRFKFRVWDRTEKIMHYNDFVIAPTGYIAKLSTLYDIEYDNDLNEEKEIKSKNEFMIDNSDLDFEKDKILMQCTGLKDKNGKLIFEGDIVERTNGFNKKRGVVEFDKAFLKFKATNMSLFSLFHRAVVIGNIYENPELLESAK